MDSSLRYRLLDRALERALLPDPVLRAGSLYGAWARERRESRGGVVGQQERLRALLSEAVARGDAEYARRLAAEQRVATLAHSYSWRLTAPLRSAARRVRDRRTARPT